MILPTSGIRVDANVVPANEALMAHPERIPTTLLPDFPGLHTLLMPTRPDTTEFTNTNIISPVATTALRDRPRAPPLAANQPVSAHPERIVTTLLPDLPLGEGSHFMWPAHTA